MGVDVHQERSGSMVTVDRSAIARGLVREGLR